MITFIKLQLID